MQTAGFMNVQVISEAADFTYATKEEAWDALWSHGARARLERIEQTRGRDVLDQLRNEYLLQMSERKSSTDIQRSFHTLYTLAVAP